MRTYTERRHNDWKKAIRKQKIASEVYGFPYYDFLHQYSKNKIHCSCPMCREKTNNKGKRKNYWAKSYNPSPHDQKQCMLVSKTEFAPISEEL